MEAYTGDYGCSQAYDGLGDTGPEEPFMLDLEDSDEPSHRSVNGGGAGYSHAVGGQGACPRRGDKTGLRASASPESYNIQTHQGNQATSAKLRRNKWINRQVTQNSNNMQRLLQTIHYHISEMNAINLVTALHRLTKLAVSGTTEYTVDRLLKEPCFKQLFGIVAQQIESSATVAPKGQPQTPPFEVQCMSMVCWSCATLRLAEERLFCIIAGIAGPQLSELKPFELSNLCWAYAKLSFGLPQLFSAVAKRMMDRRINEFSLQGLSMVVWSFATAKQKHATLFRNLAVEIHSKAADAKPQEIANTLWAYAKNRSVEAPLFHGLADVALGQDLLWTFKPQELSNTVWSFATVGLHHVPLCTAMVDVVISKRWELSPQNAANILWAYSKLQVGEQSGRLVEELLGVSIWRLPQHKPQEISAIVWAGSRDSPGSWRFFEAVAKICISRLRDFPPQALAYMVEAYGTIEQGGPASAFSKGMIRESLDRLHQFELSALTHLLAGVVQFTRNSEPEGESGSQADHARYMGALQTVCSCIAGQVEDLQDGEFPFLLQSLRLLPERSAEQGPVVEELLQAVLAEEQRRDKSHGGKAVVRTRVSRRAVAGASTQGNRPLGEIAAEAPPDLEDPEDWLRTRQPAPSMQAAAAGRDAASGPEGSETSGTKPSALSDASGGMAEQGAAVAPPAAAARGTLRASATPWSLKGSRFSHQMADTENWLGTSLLGPGAPDSLCSDQWGPEDVPSAAMTYALHDMGVVAQGLAVADETSPWWSVDPTGSRQWSARGENYSWSWDAPLGPAGRADEGPRGPLEHAVPPPALDGGGGGAEPWQAGADPATVPLPKLWLWGERASLGLPPVPSPCAADAWTGPARTAWDAWPEPKAPKDGDAAPAGSGPGPDSGANTEASEEAAPPERPSPPAPKLKTEARARVIGAGLQRGYQ